MKKYAIYFAKEDYQYFTDNFDMSNSAGGFETDDINLFYTVWFAVIKNPPALWYWVLLDGKMWCCGAIEKEDMYPKQFFDWDRCKEYNDNTLTFDEIIADIGRGGW